LFILIFIHDKVENRAINEKDHVFLSASNSTNAKCMHT